MEMILECKSCEKKFVVPDNAITSGGRLVQCSSCGNKWTQFPIIKRAENKSKISVVKIQEEKAFYPTVKKKKKIKKKVGPSIYSKEYLEKKHGISIDESASKILKNNKTKNTKKSYFGFYSYLIILLISISLFIGILNLTKEIIIFHLPFTEMYLEYLFENLNYFKILISDALNIN